MLLTRWLTDSCSTVICSIPHCGPGTFVLEALKRRLIAHGAGVFPPAHEILAGLYGIDLNPLAVLAAKASLVVVLASGINFDTPTALPIYLADAINSATQTRDGFFVHILQTELG